MLHQWSAPSELVGGVYDRYSDVWGSNCLILTAWFAQLWWGTELVWQTYISTKPISCGSWKYNAIWNKIWIFRLWKRPECNVLVGGKTNAARWGQSVGTIFGKPLQFCTKNISMTWFPNRVLFFGNSANHPLVADDTVWTITNQPLYVFQKFFHQTTAYSMPWKIVPYVTVWLSLLFLAVGRKHENLRPKNTVWLVQIQVWTADTTFLLRKTSCSTFHAWVSRNELGVTFWRTKKGKQEKLYFWRGKPHCGRMRTKMFEPFYESL